MPITKTIPALAEKNQLFSALIEGADIPDGYDVSQKGLNGFDDDGQKFTISRQPLVAVAYIRDNQQEQWSTLLRWIDLDGKLREKAFPNRMLDEGNELIKIFADLGYKVNIEARKGFRKYLSDLSPQKRLRLVKKLGWQTTADDKKIYVLPDEIIGETPDEPVHFLPDQYSPTVESIKKSGTFEEWQTKVALAASGNPIMIFCLCTAFAGPLMRYVGAESGGFHLYGESSKGKTTAVQVAATVWGNGAAPTSSSSPSFIGTWRATANALEGIAAAHNDSLLILDELGQCDATDFQRVVYDLAAGQGKARMQKDSTLSRIKKWQIIYLSTGEISAKSRMESNSTNSYNKSKAKAGQLLRLMDIPISEGVIQKSHSKSSGNFVDALKRDCAKHYGWAGPKFVQGLIDYNMATLINEMHRYKEYFLAETKVLETERQRAITRLAFICLAGQLASELEVLPLTTEEIEEAIMYVMKIWMKNSRHLNDAARAVIDLRDFISKNKARFQITTNDAPPNNMAGYIYKNRGENLYFFNDAAFVEACQGVSPDALCKELKKLKLLHLNNPGKNKSRFQPKVGEQKQPFYAVRASILELSFDENEDHLHTGTDNS